MSNYFDNVPETEPTTLVAGDLWTWKRTDIGADYSNSLYTLSYELRLEGAGATAISITASANGSDYLVSVAAATTAAYTVGEYRWDMYITRDSDSERYRLDYGIVNVVADKANATNDPRSHAKIMLDKIESLLENRADADVDSYSIAGRSLSKISISELRDWRNYYKTEVMREIKLERIRNGKATGSTIKVRF